MMMVIDDDVKKHEETALNAKYVFVFYFVLYFHNVHVYE